MSETHKAPPDQEEVVQHESLRQRLAAREAELTILTNIQAAIAAKDDLNAIFEMVGERISQLFPEQGVALHTYDAESNLVHPRYLLEEGVRHEAPPLKPGPIGQHLQATRKAVMFLTRAAFDEIGAVTIEGTQASSSGIYAPMLVNGALVGSLAVESVKQEHAFSETDLTFLTALANSLSLALENARLFDDLQRSNADLTEALRHQSAVSGILRVMATLPTEPDPVLKAVAEQARELCQADDVQVYQVEAAELLQVAHAGPLPGLDEGETLPLVPGLITGRAVLEQRTIHTHDAAQISAEEYPVSAELQQRLKHRSVIVTPMIQDEVAVGAIVARRNQVRPFSDKQIDLLATLADQAAIALENVRLVNETRRLLLETEQRAAELQIINSVQTSLSSKLDIQEIYDAVGEKLHEIFPEAQVVDILHYDPETELLHPRFVLERGKRYQVDPWKARGFRKHVVDTGQPLVINHDMDRMAKEYDNDWVVLGEKAKSFVAVPMLISGNVIGVISLQHIDREGAFSPSDVNLLETLASSMSVALENARLFDETQHLLKESSDRAAELSIINAVQRALAAELDIDSIYEVVGDQVRAIFDTQVVSINAADLSSRRVTSKYAHEKGQRLGPVSVPFNSFHEWVVDRGETFVFNGDFPEFAAQFEDYQVAQGELPQSIVGVPIPRPSLPDTVEFISLQDIDGGRTFGPSDVRLLETLAGSMSVALENARLLSETQRLLQETEQRAAELQIINSVQQGLASRVEMQAIYELIGDKIRQIFEADTTFIAYHDVENQQILAPYYNDHGDRSGTAGRPYGKGLAEIVIESGAPLILNTAEEMNAAGAVSIASPGSQEDLNQSFLGVPILREGKVIGVTSVQSYLPSAFDHNDVTLLQTLTNSMSVALENARLFDESQRLLKETEQRAAELATINTVGQALVSEAELDALIDLIGNQIRQTFHADIAYVALLDQESQTIHFPYSHGENFDPLPLGKGLTSEIIESGQPLLINQDIDQRRDELGVTQVGKRASSYLGVPIRMGGDVLGVLSAQSTAEEGRFDESDLELLNTIAANVGVALRNAQLFDEIKRQKQYYQAVIENSPAAIVLLDMQANVTGWNPAAERLFGYTKEEAFGQNIDQLVARDEELFEEAVAYSRQAMGRKEVSQLARRTRKDGSFVEVDLAGVPVSVDGEHVGFIAIYHDVTELQQARKEAEQANRAKSTFLANMSHELRTPLNAIIGFTRIVRRKGEASLPEKQVENLDKVLVSADHLLNLINTVLDIAKIEAGRMEVHAAEFQLPPLIQQVADTAQPLIDQSVKFQVQISADLPTLNTDQEKLKQILINLLSNAAKFTSRGEIKLTVGHDENALRIDVRDTGIGISEEDLAHIFEEFQQADTSSTRQYGGTGLGLSISRSLARVLGGELTATSEQGAGSTFSLTIPLRHGGAATLGATTRQSLDEAQATGNDLVVLAIDDDPNVHDLLRENLGESGYHVVSAMTGEEGIRLARELKPFAITLDIMMPHKDGWQVLHDLKADPATREIPVIMLTIVDKQSLGYKLGAADYLVKPLEEDAVVSALRRLRWPGLVEEPSRILVVDDDPNIAEMVRQLLEGEPYQIEGAADGAQALQSIQSQPPAAMLLDLIMPGMDGFALLEALKDEGAAFPIIVLTAKSLTKSDLDILEGRVERVIEKNGIDQDRLLAELKRTIGELDGGRPTPGAKRAGG